MIYSKKWSLYLMRPMNKLKLKIVAIPSMGKNLGTVGSEVQESTNLISTRGRESENKLKVIGRIMEDFQLILSRGCIKLKVWSLRVQSTRIVIGLVMTLNHPKGIRWTSAVQELMDSPIKIHLPATAVQDFPWPSTQVKKILWCQAGSSMLLHLCLE